MVANTDNFPADGKLYQATAPWFIAWSYIDNQSQVPVRVHNDAGLGITVPAMQGVPWITGGTRTISVQSQSDDTANNGMISVIISDTVSDPYPHGSGQSIVSGTVNANVLNSTLNVSVSGNVNANIINSSITALISNASLAVTDSLVELNTAVIAGLLPANVAPFTINGNGTFSQAIAKAIATFSVQINFILDGLLSIFYTASGQDVYVVRSFPFFQLYNRAALSQEKIYVAPVPAGATLNINLDQTTSSMSGVVKW